MKRKLFLIFLLAVFFFLFDRGGVMLFREASFSFYSNVKIKKSVFGKREVIKKDFYDTLIFGSSRTIAAIHPLYLFNHLGLKAYTSAKNDRYPHYFYLLYKLFKKQFGKPEYLIYGVDYFMFTLKTSKFLLISASRKKRKIKKIDLSKRPEKDAGFLKEISLLLRWKKKLDKTVEDVLYKYSLDMDRPDKNSTNAAGISNFTGNKTTLELNPDNRPATWEKFPYLDSDNGEGKYLKKLFDELETDGVIVFLVGIPDYIGTYESTSEKDRFEKDMQSLINGRKKFRFLNYNHPDKFDLHNRRFYKNGRYGHNNSHLSYYGSIPLNEILSRDIKKTISNKAGAEKGIPEEDK